MRAPGTTGAPAGVAGARLDAVELELAGEQVAGLDGRRRVQVGELVEPVGVGVSRGALWRHP